MNALFIREPLAKHLMYSHGRPYDGIGFFLIDECVPSHLPVRFHILFVKFVKLVEMKQAKYTLVNETSSKNAGCDVTYRAMLHLGYCYFVSSPDIDTLVRLRRHYPEAPILGLSEVDTSARHAPVSISEAMNRLRREMSDLP